MRHVIPISGKDSLAAAIVQTRLEPEPPGGGRYEFVFNDVGAELPETYAWLRKAEEFLGAPIVRVGHSLPRMIADEYDYYLPGPRQRYCTKMAKIRPFLRWLRGDEATVYYGLRSDEGHRGRDPAQAPNVTPRFPLRDRRPLDLRGVLVLLEAHGLTPPTFTWASLGARCDEIAGPGWEEHLPAWRVHQLLAWRTRANCYFCFYQRQYEYAGLFEHHPDLFWEACRMERVSEARNGYTWRQGYALERFADPEERARVRDRRAREVLKIAHAAKQGTLFGESGDTLIATTSCGLLCGK
jgi:hypothetical protein